MKCLQYILMIAAYFLIGTGALFSQGDRCSSIQPFCAGDERLVFPNSNILNSNVSEAEFGPDYSCLLRKPYPAWFYLQVGESGDLEFTIRQTENANGSGANLDVDFIVWGPFSEGENYCDNSMLSTANIIGCSYSPAALERMTINNAQQNEIYVVLISNFEEAPGFISLQQTNVSTGGSTDCSIVASDLGPDQNICGETSVVLDAYTSSATTYTWYVSNDNTNGYEIIPNETNPTLTVSQSGNYKVVVASDILESEDEDIINIQFNELPQATSPSPVIGCADEEGAIFDLTSISSELIEESSGSYSTRFYLSEADYDNNRTIPNKENFQGASGQIVWGAIVDETTGCKSLPVEVELEIFDPPVVNNFPESSVLCMDLNENVISPLSLGEDLGQDYLYAWNVPNDPDGDGLQNPILVIGEYIPERNISLTITHISTGCEATYSTEIQMFSPPQEVLIEISGSDFTDGYMVTATAAGAIGDGGTYEYRLDDGDWQTAPVFQNVQGGIHQVESREINGCGSAVSAPFRLIGYPRFFTPNSDGYNDRWNVINDETNSIKKVMIFDRYGNLLKQLNPQSNGWDGTVNNRIMPADDYWFLLEYEEVGTGEIKEFRGNFSLKR